MTLSDNAVGAVFAFTEGQEMDHIAGSLGPQQRCDNLARLADEHLDVLVIGGGITGVGCALDAVTRGLTVGLVEQRDIASGTSSRSSKLIHGGLRYLEQFDFALVREALHERGLLADTIAPHMIRPVSFLIPLTSRVWQRVYFGAGVLLYDILALGNKHPFPRHRHLSRRSALALMPGVKSSSLIGGILYHDAQVDDARYAVSVARTAARHGAAITTSTEVTGLIIEDATVVGAHVRDLETGDEIDIRATKVINATGVWIDQIQAMAGPAGLKVEAAKGIHITVPGDRIRGESGMVVRTKKSVLFIIPWGDEWLLGTTDTPWHLDRSHPAASSADIDYLLEQANTMLDRPLGHDDIIGVFAGLRPLIKGTVDDTTKLSREHAVAEPIPGLISIAGGKYTTYRVMAADTIDTAVEGIGRNVPSSCTADLSLIGTDGWKDLCDSAPLIAADHDISPAIVERLLWRHGSGITEVLNIADSDPELHETLTGGRYLAAEVVYAVRHEGALHLDDVLARRMRISFENRERGVATAEHVARLMSVELGWDSARTAEEVRLWCERVEAERSANAAPDDDSADTARRAATDARQVVEV